MFEKTLQDVVRGVMSLPDDASRQIFIAKILTEIKSEISQNDMPIKSNAILKLVYLYILGYDMDWAAFNIIEIMSQPQFKIQRIGHLASSQSFSEETDVIVLCSNLLKKGLLNRDPYVVGNTMNCLSNICTKELAQNLLEDLIKHLDSKFPYLRKKSILALYKLYIKYPQALPQTFEKLKSKLEDKDLTVVSTAVSVLCELAFKNPSNYLSLAPFLFSLLKTCENSWMLIKIVKLLTKLCEVEIRLAKKMIDPLCQLITETNINSLEFECISALCICFPFTEQNDDKPKSMGAAIKLCVERLTKFVQSPDCNQKYLGLQCFCSLMNYDPALLKDAISDVLGCLEHDDITIRNKSLEIIKKYVNNENLIELVDKLMTHVENTEDPIYKDTLIDTIIYMCSYDEYLYCDNFAWYVSVLVDLAYISNTTKGKLVNDQLLEIVLRVEQVRNHCVNECISIIKDPSFYEGTFMTYVLSACSWIIGEFPTEVPFEDHTDILKCILKPEIISFPYHIQSSFIQCAFKLYVSLIKLLKKKESNQDELLKKSREVAYFITSHLTMFIQSYDVEVQQRSHSLQRLFCSLDPFIDLELQKVQGVQVDQSQLDKLDKTSSGVLKHKLLTINDIKFQEVQLVNNEEERSKVKIDLDLDKWIGEPFESKLDILSVLSFSEKIPDSISLLPNLGDNDADAYYLNNDGDDDDEQLDDVVIEELKPEDLGDIDLKVPKRRQGRHNAPDMKYTVKRSDRSKGGHDGHKDGRPQHRQTPSKSNNNEVSLANINLNDPQSIGGDKPREHRSHRGGDNREHHGDREHREHRGERDREHRGDREHREHKEGDREHRDHREHRSDKGGDRDRPHREHREHRGGDEGRGRKPEDKQ